jgi:hypothetical protein
MRSSLLLVLTASCLALLSCKRSNFDQEIIGVWENSGIPASTAISDEIRRDGAWSSEIKFNEDGSFEWVIDEASKKTIWAGVYNVEAFALEIEVTKMNGANLPAGKRLRYAVRQQGTGSIRLPLPQDWTGPSVDYFPKR